MGELGEGFGRRPWTERGLQDLLAAKFNGSGSLCVPNCEAFGWEGDLVRVTPRLYCAEYEIKVSLADFRHDSTKVWKHIRLEDCTELTGERRTGRGPQSLLVRRAGRDYSGR